MTDALVADATIGTTTASLQPVVLVNRERIGRTLTHAVIPVDAAEPPATAPGVQGPPQTLPGSASRPVPAAGPDRS